MSRERNSSTKNATPLSFRLMETSPDCGIVGGDASRLQNQSAAASAAQHQLNFAAKISED